MICAARRPRGPAIGPTTRLRRRDKLRRRRSRLHQRANGRDKVSGGKGNDAINVSTAGPAKVKCGKGKDTVRYNHNERRRVKGCERRYSIQKTPNARS